MLAQSDSVFRIAKSRGSRSVSMLGASGSHGCELATPVVSQLPDCNSARNSSRATAVEGLILPANFNKPIQHKLSPKHSHGGRIEADAAVVVVGVPEK